MESLNNRKGGVFMNFYSKPFIEECKQKLLIMKAEVLNELKLDKKKLNDVNDRSGDEMDQASRLSDEKRALIDSQRRYQKLRDVEQALARIEEGTYGICEETEEYIEEGRLRAMPETHLSIEGAEIKENRQRESRKTS